jgi:hypothetical protein
MPKEIRNPKLPGRSRLVGVGHAASALVRLSKIGVRVSGLAVLLSVGCVSQDAAREQARQAFDAGFRQGQQAAAIKLTHVFLRGEVQRQTVPWADGLTLAQAIVEAVYTSPRDPVAISVTREGRIIPVDPKELLRGIDFPLEPGDAIDIR